MTEATTAFPRRTAFELFLLSVLSLYVELLVIRWLSSEIRIFAYFKNMALMACLFGLGLGLALAGSKRNFSRWFPLGLAAVTSLICFAEPLHLVHITFIDPVENYLLGIHVNFAHVAGALGGILALIPGLLILAGIFYLVAFTFACMGQKLGQLFDSFEPLVAYSINVAGALVGILLFSLVSFLAWRPDAWLLLAALMWLWLYRKPDQIVVLVLSVFLAYSVANANPNVFWSPYYRISVEQYWIPGYANVPPFQYGWNINVNHDFIAGAWDHRPETLAKLPGFQMQAIAEHYEWLYQLIGDKPRETLVLAAGPGNDVAMALRHGATDVDAVDIDPLIIGFGRLLHVEKPYSNPRVHIYIDDARAFVRRATKKYDLVDIGYLDSHTAFSSMSSVRLDNYVYTADAIRDYLKLLKPGGILAINYYTITPWQQTRFFKNLQLATGEEEPVCVVSRTGKTTTYLAGQGVDRQHLIAAGNNLLSKAQLQENNARAGILDWQSIDPSTDDWPYFFLKARGMTFSYAFGLLFTVLIGFGLLKICFRDSFKEPVGKNMFFLGAGFMLVEVKSVTQMGLLLGTTWLVNSAVIGAILLMILLANLMIMRTKIKNPNLLYALLVVSLVVSYMTPLSVFNSLPFVQRAVAGALLLSMPIFFAAPIFAINFARAKSPHSALGMNLLGTLVGGMLEYLSMMMGISSLNLVAIVLYILAWFTGSRAIAASTVEAKS